MGKKQLPGHGALVFRQTPRFRGFCEYYHEDEIPTSTPAEEYHQRRPRENARL
jgi:hypothetical protein